MPMAVTHMASVLAALPNYYSSKQIATRRKSRTRTRSSVENGDDAAD
jgi:hypothetical protein